jgi:hypothetical protein
MTTAPLKKAGEFRRKGAKTRRRHKDPAFAFFLLPSPRLPGPFSLDDFKEQARERRRPITLPRFYGNANKFRALRPPRLSNPPTLPVEQDP